MAGISSLTGLSLYSVFLVGAIMALPSSAHALDLVSHKAIYDIRMVSSKNGAQVIGVNGKMLYTVKKSCDGWISDHRFTLDYEYSGTPPVQVETKFTSFESFDGNSLNFSSNRMSNGEFDQELRGQAHISKDPMVENSANFSIPSDLSFKLSPTTLFPVNHTIRLIEAAQKGQKIMNAKVFDGSDDKGPVEINAVIGKKVKPDSETKFDKTLMNVGGWSMRLAVFTKNEEDEPLSDYEMTMELLENGIVKNMIVDYHDFSVSQKLVAIEPVKPEECGAQ